MKHLKEDLLKRIQELEAENAALRSLHKKSKIKKNPPADPLPAMVFPRDGFSDHFQTIARRSDGLFFTLDGKGKVTSLSDFKNEIFGYTLSEIIDQHFISFLHPAFVETAKKIFRDIIAGTPCIDFELPIVKKNGETFWGGLSAFPYHAQPDKIGVTGFIKDITDTKKKILLLKAQQRLSDMSFYSSLESLLDASLEEMKRFTQTTSASVLFVDKPVSYDDGDSSDTAWNEYSSSGPKKRKALRSQYSEKQDECIRTSQHVIDNLKQKGRKPFRELHVPMLRSGAVTGVVSLAGKATLFDQNDVDFVVQLTKLLSDLIQRKRRELHLLADEKKFRGIIEQAEVGVVIADRGYNIRYTNAFLQKLLGYSAEELNKLPVDKLVPEEERAAFELQKKSRAKGINASFEQPLCRKDGSTCWVIVSANGLRDEHKNFTGVVAFLADISGKKLVEEALLESEERMRSFMENSLIGFYRTTPQGQILFANNALLRMIGFDSYEEISSRDLDLEGYVDANLRGEFLRRIAADGMVAGFEVQWRHRDGSAVWVCESAYPVRDEQGNIVYFDGTVENITDRKKAESYLVESEERYRTIFEQAGDYALLLKSIPGDLPIIVDMNQAAVEAHGYTREEIIGQPISYIDPDITEYLVNKRLSEVNARPNVFIPLRHRRKDGSLFDIEAKIKTILLQGEEYIVSIERDVTILKQFEKENLLLAQTLRSVRDCVSITDLNNHLIFVNDAFTKTYGYQPSELLGKHISIVGGTHVTELQTQAIMSATQIAGWHGEMTNIKKDGTSFPIELWTSVVKDKNGNAIALVGVARDITATKEAALALKENEELLLTLINSMPDIVCFKDGNGRWLVANDFDLRLFQLEGVDYKHKKDSELAQYSPFYRDALMTCEESDEKAWRAGQLIRGEEIIPRPDGAPMIFDIIKQPIYDESGNRKGLIVVGRDITARITAEQKIQKSEKLFKTFFEKNPLGVAFVAEDSYIMQVNDALLKMLGYTFGEVLGHQLIEFSHPDDRERTLKKIAEFISSSEDLLHYEKRYIRKDGGEIWGDVTVLKLLDEDGSFLYNIPLIEDITDRKRAEQFLQESEAKYRLLAENMSDVIWRLDLRTRRFTYVSPSIYQLRGYTAEEVMEQSLEECVTPESLLFIQRWIQEIFESPALPQPTGFLYPLREVSQMRKDGSIVVTEVASSIVRDSDNIPIEIIGISRDITERKKTDLELLRLKLAVETSGEAIFQTNKNGIIIYVNPAFTALYGYSPDEIIGKATPRIIKSGQHDKPFYRWFWQTLLNGGQLKIELVNKTKNGDLVFIETTIDPIVDEQQTIFGFVAIQHNITQRKLAEQELIQAKEKAEEAVRVKTNFLSNMSHEIRTPMIGILGYSELLIDKMTDPDAKLMTQKIFEGGKRLLGTLNLILDLSRLEASKYEKRIARVDLVDLVNLVVGLFQGFANKKGIDLSIETNSEQFFVYSDSRILNEILNNLINNALKYTDAGSVVVRLELPAPEDNNYFRISVEDTGIGIPEESLSVIFEEFRQVSEGRSRAFEGTGLGLALTKKFVEKLGGHISVESKVNIGSQFRVVLPVKEGNDSTVDHDILHSPGMQARPLSFFPRENKILLVENEQTNAQLIEEYLKASYKVEYAENAEAALALVQKEYFSLILMDINLGAGMDGIQLTNAIKSLPGYENVTVVAMTAFALDGDREEFLANGCDDYIAKPFYRDELLRLVGQYIPPFNESETCSD